MLHELAKQIHLPFPELNVQSIKEAFMIDGGCVDPAGLKLSLLLLTYNRIPPGCIYSSLYAHLPEQRTMLVLPHV